MPIIADLAIEDFANAKNAKGALKRASRGFSNISAGLRIMLTFRYSCTLGTEVSTIQTERNICLQGSF